MIFILDPSGEISEEPELRIWLGIFLKDLEDILKEYFFVGLDPILEIWHKIFICDFFLCCKLQTDKTVINVA